MNIRKVAMIRGYGGSKRWSKLFAHRLARRSRRMWRQVWKVEAQ